MKNKYFLKSFGLLIIIGLFILYRIFFNQSSKSVIILFLGALLIGELIILFRAFAVPSRWAFNNRFGIEGLLLTIPLLLIVSLAMDHGLSFLSVSIDLIIGGIFGYFLLGYINKSNYNKKIRKIDPVKLNDDSQILSDLASYKENDIKVSGVLILNNQKLIFIPVDPDRLTNEIDLLEQKPSIRIKSKLGIPSGLIINDNLQLSLSYPKLWIKKINAA